MREQKEQGGRGTLQAPQMGRRKAELSGSLAVGMTGPDDLSALQLPSPYSALWLGNLVITVGGKANNALLVLLKENKRKTV